MIQLRSFFFIAIIFIMLGCNDRSSTETSETKDSTSVHRDSSSNPPIDTSGQIMYSYIDLDSNMTRITLPDLTITIDSFIFNKGTTQGRQIDSIIVEMQPGVSIEGRQLTLTSELTNIRIEQRYETSVTISNEGPHCDLKDWKHYYSDWTVVSQNAQNRFTVAAYNMNERKRFIDVPMNELKEQVRKQCGEFWYNLVKNINSPNTHPASVVISRYYLKITGMDQGKQVTRNIVFVSPMGD